MGGGGGVIIEEIGLAQFQASRGAELNVEVNGGVNTYTWVAGGEYTVSANVEIIFEETDRMVIPGNTTVTLEGIFNISETTDNFSRIQNDGTLTIAEGAEIQFGRIVGSEGGEGEDDGIGIQNDGTLTIAEGAEIEFGTIVGTPGGEETPSGIGIRTTSSDSTYVLGKITFNKLDVAAVGLDVHSSAAGRGGKVTLESTGRLIFKTIESNNTESYVDGIFIDDNGIFEQSGSIEVESIIGTARLMTVGRFDTDSPSRYTQTSEGTITIENMIGLNKDKSSAGILIISGGTFTQNGSVRIQNVQENATCIHVGISDAPHPAFCNYNQNENAVITIDKVAGRDVETDDDNNSTGIFITGKGIFTQNGTITFEDIQQNVTGIVVGDITAAIENAIYKQESGTITIKKIAGSNNNNSNGISTQGLGTFTQNGNITIKDIQQNADGILVGTSNGTKDATYVQQTGTIAIESIHSEGDKYSTGIAVSGGTEVTFTQNDDIRIENVTGLVNCIVVGSDDDDAGNKSTYNQAGGSLTISDVRTIDSAGDDDFTNGVFFSDSNSKYNQTGGTINITNIGGADTVRGILVKAGELIVTNQLTITGLDDGTGLGLESRVENGVKNSGTVTVSDFKLNYTDNGETNLNPPGDFPEFEVIDGGEYN